MALCCEWRSAAASCSPQRSATSSGSRGGSRGLPSSPQHPRTRPQVSAADLQHVLLEFGLELADNDAASLIAEADTDGTGVLNYTEFMQTMLDQVRHETSCNVMCRM